MPQKIAPKYVYIEETHNLEAPRRIVPIIRELAPAQSIIDIGCGTGTFLKIFKDAGVTDIKGLDGNWVNREMLLKNIREEEFMEVDLEKLSFETINKTYDLALCLEVAEHLAPEAADLLVSNLTRFSKKIIFSAAIPFQGGINHVNEQWPEYWKQKFARHDYHFYDVIRPRIWNDKQVPYWYKQNMFLVCHKDVAPTMPDPLHGAFDNSVHPDLYMIIASRLDKTENLELPLYSYLKMMGKKVLGRGRK